ncbi:hypothetical protein NM688_g3850 [Phlebia brevispora]|uniref:Uncharacterized protein n=1 Tax=Phlebia brevispora TaxID=194682 RepID=A0ACC1T4T2_9APHY|nr:hypothetical protein NM688_g3850 [Phlebia brevispora]
MVKMEEVQASIDAVALLGSQDGDAVRKILEDDKEAAGAGHHNLKGIRIFETKKVKHFKKEEPNDVAMDVDSDSQDAPPKLPFSGEELDADPVLSLLGVTVNMRDTPRLCRYLNPAIVTRVKTSSLNLLVAWLFEIATSPSQDALLGQRAFESLMTIARHSLPIASLSQFVLSALLRLGAKSETLERIGIPIPILSVPDSLVIDEEVRHRILARVVDVIRTFAGNNAVYSDDLPDLILSLLSIALEPSSSPELQTDIMVTIDVLGSCVPSGSDGFSHLESDICSKVLSYAANFKPVNKAFLLSFFCGGSVRTARIARWLARRLLLPDAESATYSDYPPLKPLIALVTPRSGSKEVFDIPGNSEEENYFEDLASYVEILSYCLNDIDKYAQDEREKEKSDGLAVTSSYASPGKSVEKPLTELEQLKHSLDRLHGKIADTRSVDLARSAAKAALQQLAIRIHYTRGAVRGRGPARSNGGGLKSWLKPIKRSSAT